MITIENSSIVNWDNYPEYVCAVVMQTTEDMLTTTGHIMPKGEEITWLLDIPPEINGDDVTLNGRCNCMGGFGPGNGHHSGISLPMEVVEIHFKPKPVIKIESKQECYA